MNLKKQLEDSLEKFKGDSLTILEFEELFGKVQKFFPSDEELSNLPKSEGELADQLAKRAFFTRLTVYENYIDRWSKGLFFPSEKELEKLRNHQKNLEKGRKIDLMFDNIMKQSPHLTDEIERQRKEAKEIKEKLQQLLKNDEPRQKAEDLLKKYKDNHSFSDNNSGKDIENEFNEQITSLQNQIKDLENKQNQDSNLERDHKYKQELERLKEELEKLKVGQKYKPQKEEKQSKNGDNFSWKAFGIVAIVATVAIIVLLVVKKFLKI